MSLVNTEDVLVLDIAQEASIVCKTLRSVVLPCMLQRLRLQLGMKPSKMRVAPEGILKTLPGVKQMHLSIFIALNCVDDSQEISMLRDLLDCLPVCSRIGLMVLQDPGACLRSTLWQSLVEGLGGRHEGRPQEGRPWGSRTQCSVFIDIRKSELEAAWSMLMTSLSTLRPVLSLQAWTARASNYISHGIGDHDYQEIGAPYFARISVPHPLTRPEHYAQEGLAAMSFMDLPVARLDLTSAYADCLTMRNYLTTCRTTLVSLALAEIDSMGCSQFRGLDIIPRLKYLKLVRITTQVAESLLDSLRVPALRHLLYETIKNDDLAGFLLEYLPRYFGAHPSLREFDLHVRTNASAWTEQSLSIGHLYDQLQQIKRVTMTLNYRGSLVLPTLQEHAFMAPSIVELRKAFKTMVIKLKRDEDVDWSGIQTTHFPNMLQLHVIVADDTSEGFNLFRQFFRHFRFPALKFVRISIQDPAFAPYLDFLVQDILAYLDLQGMTLYLNAADDTIGRYQRFRFDGSEPDCALHSLRRACGDWSISLAIQGVEPHLALRGPIARTIW